MNKTKNPAAAVTVVFTLLHVGLKVSDRNCQSIMKKEQYFSWSESAIINLREIKRKRLSNFVESQL